MFSTVRRLTQLEWSPFLEETGANFNEDGPLQMTSPDPDGVSPMTNLYDRSFKEHNMSATWNGSMSANPVDRSQVIHLSVVSSPNISRRVLRTIGVFDPVKICTPFILTLYTIQQGPDKYKHYMNSQ